MEPTYQHNCKQCRFLGTFSTRQYNCETEQMEEVAYDLYWCPQDTIPTVLARYGDAGEEYLSGMPTDKGFYERYPDYALHEAYRRAKVAGWQVSPLH